MKLSVIEAGADLSSSLETGFEAAGFGHISPRAIMEESPDTIPPHPLGIKPSGNVYTATRDARSAIGLFNYLPDEVLMTLLEYFDSKLLIRLGATCKALYAFTRAEELWKALFIE